MSENTERNYFGKLAKTAQKMNIWKGIVLIGATTDKKCIKNGTRYKIIDIVQDVISLYQINDKDEQQGDTFTMTHKMLAKSCC